MQLHLIKGYIQNIHLVEYQHGCLLLDGCCRADLAIILAYFKNVLNRPITDLRVVVVTHMHPDHAGCAMKLKSLSNCIIATGQYSNHWYGGWRGRLAHLIDISLAWWVAGRLGKKRKNIWYTPHLNECVQLTDMQAIPVFPEWRAIATPGHTDRDISLLNKKEKLLYVADLIVQVKSELHPPFPVYLPHEYKNSLAKIKQYTGYKLLMAHVHTQTISAEAIDNLLAIAPNTPKTNWHSVKAKLKRIIVSR